MKGKEENGKPSNSLGEKLIGGKLFGGWNIMGRRQFSINIEKSEQKNQVSKEERASDRP